MRQGNGSDLLGQDDPRSADIGILYVEPEDSRQEILTVITTEDAQGRKQIAIVLPDQGKAFCQPVEFDGLKNMRRNLKAHLIFIARPGPGPAEFARQRRFVVYSSLETFKTALLSERASLNPRAKGTPGEEKKPGGILGWSRASRGLQPGSSPLPSTPPAPRITPAASAQSAVSPTPRIVPPVPQSPLSNMQTRLPIPPTQPAIPPTLPILRSSPQSSVQDAIEVPALSAGLPTVQKQFGNYQLTDHLLGEGGFAKVYLGQHIYLETSAAIKVLSKEQMGPKEREDFLREARILANLVHPHIVRLLDFGIQNGTPFLVMEYAPGKSLRDVHPRGTSLSLETTLKYARQVANALQFAHDRHLIHRDIKPQNMLIGQDGEIQIADFGIALAVQSSRALNTQEAIGTVHYMAPEQSMGKPHLSSDQYALAVVIYEWLTGNPPFQGNFYEIYGQHLHAQIPSLLDKRPDLPPEIETVLRRALAKTPEERFSTVSKFVDALEQAGRTLPAHTHIPGNQLELLSPEAKVTSKSKKVEALVDMYDGVRQNIITEPRLILDLAQRFEDLANDSVYSNSIDFDAMRAAATLRQRAQKLQDLLK